MTYSLPMLPFADDALMPHMSKETFDFHHKKHHQAYITKANELLPGSALEGMGLEAACVAASKNPAQGALFNQLGQHYNHSLFWQSLAPQGGGKSMPATLAQKIDQDLGGFDAFREKFIQAGMTQFGSGWAWLSLDNATGKLEISKTANADTPLVHNKTPLLVCDVWEHSYYIDYRNARQKYLEVFFDHLANWENAARLLAAGPLKIAA
jgi:superoxide dismutase, Fe-Mn family